MARRYDPSGTGKIREDWARDVRVRSMRVERLVQKLIESNAGLSLGRGKVEELLSRMVGGEWPRAYIVRAYRRGLDNSAAQLKIKRSRKLGEVHLREIGDLTRLASEDAARITRDAAAKIEEISKAAAGPDEAIRLIRQYVRKHLTRRLFAVANVRTIMAQSFGQLRQYDDAGIRQTRVDPELVKHSHSVRDDMEFATAGDDRVCPECFELESQVFTVEEARGIIPVHPGCRCAWIPIPPEDFSEEELLEEGVSVEELGLDPDDLSLIPGEELTLPEDN